jgi:hypothetical protein
MLKVNRKKLPLAVLQALSAGAMVGVRRFTLDATGWSSAPGARPRNVSMIRWRQVEHVSVSRRNKVREM